MHGWWETDTKPECPSHADVTVLLQGVWCDFNKGICWWKRVDKKSDSIRHGGGSGKIVVARGPCYTNELTGYRAVTDVDLPGIVDPPDKLYTDPIDLACRPPNWQ